MSIDISRESLSKIVRKKIIDYIEENDLKPGDQLPSELKLVKMFGISRITVREALAQFNQEGIIYKIQGKGTFLKRSPIHMKNGLEILKSPAEIMKDSGYEPKTVHYSSRPIEPSPEMRKNLKLRDDEKIITYRRKRYTEDKLVVYGEDSLSVRHFSDEIPAKIPQESMFHFLEENPGLIIERAQTEIIPTLLGREMAEMLDVEEGKIFLLLKQIYYSNKGEPLVFSLDYFNSEAFQFIINRRRINQ